MDFLDLPYDFRLVDLFDIAIVSGFFYALLSWLLRTATRAAAIGAITLGGVYLLARSLGMVLTTTVFHTGAIVCLVALVVVFQEDVRRGLQRLSLRGGALRGRLKQSTEAKRAEVELLVDVTSQLAEAHTGALLVLAGKEPLTAHLSSGIPVSGELNRELLLSIFHPGSPGHDGAVVIDRGNLWQFAAHLPLAHRPLAPEMGGTRHRAAVGLSERCDALVIVVSEERGVISVAEGGEIAVVEAGDQLRRRLYHFVESRFPRVTRGVFVSLTENLHIKLLSIVLAATAWSLLVAGPGTIHRTFAVPIQYRDLPPDLALADDAPQEARVTLAGPEIAFNALDPGLLIISLDVSGAQLGTNHVLLTEDDLQHPPRLTVDHMTPREIILRVERAPPPSPSEVMTP